MLVVNFFVDLYGWFNAEVYLVVISLGALVVVDVAVLLIIIKAVLVYREWLLDIFTYDFNLLSKRLRTQYLKDAFNVETLDDVNFIPTMKWVFFSSHKASWEFLAKIITALFLCVLFWPFTILLMCLFVLTVCLDAGWAKGKIRSRKVYEKLSKEPPKSL